MSNRTLRRKMERKNAKALRDPSGNGAGKSGPDGEAEPSTYDLAVVFHCCGATNACTDPGAVKAAFERGLIIRLACKVCGKAPPRRPVWAPPEKPLIVPATAVPSQLVKGR